MQIEIIPLTKLVIDNNSINLGMKKADVESVLGRGVHIDERYYYYDSELAIDYNNKQRVEFIEFLGGIEGTLRPMIYGVSAFEVEEDELVALLTSHNYGEVEDTENGYSLAFLNSSVGVFRQIKPSDIDEMIEEMKADGVPIEGNEDLEADIRKSKHWDTIGFGVDGYYR